MMTLAFSTVLPIHPPSTLNLHLSPFPSTSLYFAQKPRRSQLANQSPAKSSPRCELSLTEVVKHALTTKYAGDDIKRVTQSFTDIMSGRTLEKDEGKPTHQRATSFISGLDCAAFHDYEANPGLAWVTKLESRWQDIHDELMMVMSQSDLEAKGNNIWAPPVVEAAQTYGPNWRTLVLQNRTWDPVNTKLFPRTTQLLQDTSIDVPCVEAFFARQPPKTGIHLHTDDCNFILTMHLGLQVPTPPASWIEVAGERRAWEQGKSLVFDTSFYHQTMNEDADIDRIVLLIRFWHPQLSLVEREAISYLFKLIEDPDNDPDMIKAKKELMNLPASKKVKKKSASPARGFGN